MTRDKTRSIGHAALATLTALVMLLALGAGPALAAEKGVVTFFGGSGSEGDQFVGAKEVAVNQNGAGGVSAGDIYVADPGNHRIQEFTASGEFVRAFGLNVGGSGVDVCTVASSCGAAEASGQAGAITTLSGLGIDQATGTVYVGDAGYTASSEAPANARIDVFSATGEFEGAFGWNVKATGGAEELQFCTTETGCKTGSLGEGPGQFNLSYYSALDTTSTAVSPLNGHVIVADVVNGRIDEFAPDFEEGKVTGISFVHSFGGGSVVGVDQSGRVYAARQGKINAYSPSGELEGTFVEFPLEIGGHGATPNSIAVDNANGDILAMWSTKLEVYGPSGELLETYLEGAVSHAFIWGVAVNEETETIYLTTSEPEAGVLVLGEVVPATASIEPVGAFTGTTATFEGQVNPEGFFAKYHFEYSADGVHWSALPEVELPADSEEHAVSQEATGLEAHTDYRVRLVAEKLFHSGRAEAETSFETGASMPLASAPSFEDVTDTAVKLTGTVNPENEATSYRFECVTQAQFEAGEYAGAIEAPSGGAVLEAGGKAVEIGAPLSGLSPSIEYRCRLVASNESGPVAPQEASFTTYAAQPLGPPDGRAYEQVTPVDKNGGDARGVGGVLQAAPDGGAATYVIIGGGSAEGGEQNFPAYSAMRSPGNWASRGFLPSASYGGRASVFGWSEDTRRDYVLARHRQEAAQTLYEQNLENGAMTAIATGLEGGRGVAWAGESGDGTKVLFESEEALNAEATAGWNNLYLWNRATRKMSLLDIGPSGTPPFHGAFAGPYDWRFSNPKRGGADSGLYATQQLHALSEDGSTAFFTSYNVNQLYARTGLDTAHPETVQASASQKTNGSGSGGADPHGPKKAAFMEATPDGRYVFFTSQEELTNDATTGTEDQGNDLYRYDTESGELIDIAPDGTDANGAEVLGVLGSSADGSYVYFAANGVAAEGASAGSCGGGSAAGHACNIYLWHEGEVSFLARVEAEGLNWIPGKSGTAWIPRTSRVSRNGTLVFGSTLSPTAYDSEGKEEFYRYEPEGELRCVTCNPTGAPPVGKATLMDITRGFTGTAGAGPPWLRNLSANGKRFFFETADQLVASDVNGHGGCPQSKSKYSPSLSCQDVYEWEAKGEGSCESEAQDGGCLYLISTGQSEEAAYFGGASENGDDVFFFTFQSLVRQDKDNLQDLYDARVGGGIASQNEEPEPLCEGEGCRGPASSAPATESAGSAGFSGPANPVPVHRAHKKKRHAKKHHRRHAHHRRRGRKRHGKRHGANHASKARAGR